MTRDYSRLPKFFPDEHMPSVIEHVGHGGTLLDWCDSRDVVGEHLPEQVAERPSHDTVQKWLRDPANADFKRAYDQSREIGYDALAARTLRVARTPVLGEVTEETHDLDEDGNATQGRSRKVRKEDQLGRSKLIVDTSMKLLGLWSHKYSPRTRVGGDEDGPPLMTKSERDIRIEALVAEAISNKAAGKEGGE